MSDVLDMSVHHTGDLFGRTDRELAIDQVHEATAIYTAEPVVEELLDMLAWPGCGGRLVDTSCGDGAFLRCALKRLLDEVEGVCAANLHEYLEGWEIHDSAADEARAGLEEVLVNRGWKTSAARAAAAGVVHTADFLVDGPKTPTFTCIVGNPPYLRYSRVPDVLRAQYEAMVASHAQADLLHSFIDHCAKCLVAGGEVAMVTADRWLFAEGAAKLRQVIGSELGISHLERLDVTSCFYRPKRRRAGTPPRVHPVAIVMRHRDECTLRLTHEPIYPGQLLEGAGDGRTLGDVATVRLAPWLGTDGIFLIDHITAKRLPEEFLVPAIDTDDILGGKLQTPKRFAIRTTPDDEPAGAVGDHLKAQMHRMCARGRKPKWWMPPETFHKLDLSKPCLLIPRIAKVMRPVRVPAGVLPVNHGLSVISSGQMGLDEIEEKLNSPFAQEWMMERGARLENGYRSVTTKLLRTMAV